jgi:hypothetical protein
MLLEYILLSLFFWLVDGATLEAYAVLSDSLWLEDDMAKLGGLVHLTSV